MSFGDYEDYAPPGIGNPGPPPQDTSAPGGYSDYTPSSGIGHPGPPPQDAAPRESNANEFNDYTPPGMLGNAGFPSQETSAYGDYSGTTTKRMQADVPNDGGIGTPGPPPADQMPTPAGSDNRGWWERGKDFLGSAAREVGDLAGMGPLALKDTIDAGNNPLTDPGAFLKDAYGSAAGTVQSTVKDAFDVGSRIQGSAAIAANDLKRGNWNNLPSDINPASNAYYAVTGDQAPWMGDQEYNTRNVVSRNPAAAILPGKGSGEGPQVVPDSVPIIGGDSIFDLPVVGGLARAGTDLVNSVRGDSIAQGPSLDVGALSQDLANGMPLDQAMEKYKGSAGAQIVSDLINPANFVEVPGVSEAIKGIFETKTARALGEIARKTEAAGVWTPELAAETTEAVKGGGRVFDMSAPNKINTATGIQLDATAGLSRVSTAPDAAAAIYDGAAYLAAGDTTTASNLAARYAGTIGGTPDGILNTMERAVTGVRYDFSSKGLDSSATAVSRSLEAKSEEVRALGGDPRSVPMREAAAKLGVDLNRVTEQMFSADPAKVEAARAARQQTAALAAQDIIRGDIRAGWYAEAGIKLPGTESQFVQGMQGIFSIVRGLMLAGSAPPLALQKFTDEWFRAMTQGTMAIRLSDTATGQALARFAEKRNLLGQGARAQGFLDRSTVGNLLRNDVLPPSAALRDVNPLTFRGAFTGKNRYGEAIKPGDRFQALASPVDKWNQSLIAAPTQHVVLNALSQDTRNLGITRALAAQRVAQAMQAAGYAPADVQRAYERARTATNPGDLHQIANDLEPIVPARGMAKGSPARMTMETAPPRVAENIRATGGAEQGLVKEATTPARIRGPRTYEEYAALGGTPIPGERGANLGSAGAGTSQPFDAAAGDGGAGFRSLTRTQDATMRRFGLDQPGDLTTLEAGMGGQFDRTRFYGEATGAPRSGRQGIDDTAARPFRDAINDTLKGGGTLDERLQMLNRVNPGEVASDAGQAWDRRVYLEQRAAHSEMTGLDQDLAAKRITDQEYFHGKAELEGYLRDLAELRAGVNPDYAARSKTLGQERFGSASDPLAQQINAKDWYHGTGAHGLTPERLSPTATYTDGLYGPGVYLTDNQGVAKGYGYGAVRRGKTGAESAQVYGARTNAGKVLDLDAPAPQEVRDLWQQHTEQGWAFDTPDTEWEKLLANPKTSTRQLFDAARELTRYGDLTFDLGDLFAEFNQDMTTKLGYDGYTHVGGNRVGNVEHRVFIALDPNDVYGSGRAGIITDFAARPQRAEMPNIAVNPRMREMIGQAAPFPREGSAMPIGREGSPPLGRAGAPPLGREGLPASPAATAPLRAPDHAAAQAGIRQAATDFGGAGQAAVNAGLARGYRIVGNNGDQTTAGAWMKNGIGGVTPPVLPFAPFHIHSAQFWAEYFTSHPALALGMAQVLQKFDDYGTLKLAGGNTLAGLIKMTTGLHVLDWAQKAYEYARDNAAAGNGNIGQQLLKNVNYDLFGNNAVVRPFEYVSGPMASLTQRTTNPLLDPTKRDFTTKQPLVDPRDQLREYGSMNGTTGFGQRLNDLAGGPVPRNVVSGATNPGQALGNQLQRGTDVLFGVDRTPYSPDAAAAHALGFVAEQLGLSKYAAEKAFYSPTTPQEIALGKQLHDAVNVRLDTQAMGKLAPLQARAAESTLEQKGIYAPKDAKGYMLDMPIGAGGFTAKDLLNQPGNYYDTLTKIDAAKQRYGANSPQVRALEGELSKIRALDVAQSPGSLGPYFDTLHKESVAKYGDTSFRGTLRPNEQNAYDAFNDLRGSADYRRYSELKAAEANAYAGSKQEGAAWYKANVNELNRVTGIVAAAEQSIVDRFGVNPKELANRAAVAAGRGPTYTSTAIGTSGTNTASPSTSAANPSYGAPTNRAPSGVGTRAGGSTNAARGTSASGNAQAANDFYDFYRTITDRTEKAAVLRALDKAGINPIGQKNVDARTYERALTVAQTALDAKRATPATTTARATGGGQPSVGMTRAQVEAAFAAIERAAGLPGGGGTRTPPGAQPQGATAAPVSTFPGGGGVPKGYYVDKSGAVHKSKFPAAA